MEKNFKVDLDNVQCRTHPSYFQILQNVQVSSGNALAKCSAMQNIESRNPFYPIIINTCTNVWYNTINILVLIMK